MAATGAFVAMAATALLATAYLGSSGTDTAPHPETQPATSVSIDPRPPAQSDSAPGQAQPSRDGQRGDGWEFENRQREAGPRDAVSDAVSGDDARGVGHAIQASKEREEDRHLNRALLLAAADEPAAADADNVRDVPSAKLGEVPDAATPPGPASAATGASSAEANGRAESVPGPKAAEAAEAPSGYGAPRPAKQPPTQPPLSGKRQWEYIGENGERWGDKNDTKVGSIAQTLFRAAMVGPLKNMKWHRITKHKVSTDTHLPVFREMRGLEAEHELITQLDLADPNMFKRAVDVQRRRLDAHSEVNGVNFKELKRIRREAFVAFAIKFEAFVGCAVSTVEKQSPKERSRELAALYTVSKDVQQQMTALRRKKSNPVAPGPAESRWRVGMETVARRYIELKHHVKEGSKAPYRNRDPNGVLTMTDEAHLTRKWLDDWDHTDPNAYQEMSKFRRFVRNPLFGNWDAFRHLHGQLSMMQMLEDIFDTLRMDFSANKGSWNGSFTANVVQVIQSHVDAHISARKMHAFGNSKHKTTEHLGGSVVGTAVMACMLTASVLVLKQVKGFVGNMAEGMIGGDCDAGAAEHDIIEPAVISGGDGGAAVTMMTLGSVSKLINVVAKMKKMHGSRQIAEEAINQINPDWVQARALLRQKAGAAVDVASANGHVYSLKVVIPEVALDAAVYDAMAEFRAGGAASGQPE